MKRMLMVIAFLADPPQPSCELVRRKHPHIRNSF